MTAEPPTETSLPPLGPGLSLTLFVGSFDPKDKSTEPPIEILPEGAVVARGARVMEGLLSLAREDGDQGEALLSALRKRFRDAIDDPDLSGGNIILIAPELGSTLRRRRAVARLAEGLKSIVANIRVLKAGGWAETDMADAWAEGFGTQALCSCSPGVAPSGEDGALLPPASKRETLMNGVFAPRNNIVGLDETKHKAPWPQIADFAKNRKHGDIVIVGCMKNEGPFLLEWIAFHRTIGVDHFVIYTNDCSDGTDDLLDRLAEKGLVTHIDNTKWKGNSPQQYALNQAMKLPIVQNAGWLIHIDADEFINIRAGDGTFPGLLDLLPKDVTNIAMTWRMFGSAGVRSYADQPIIAQFDKCAPAFLPKPHTAWGFKTAVRNIGAYAKLSCHRPNKMEDGRGGEVKWVNGSGRDITKTYAQKGWRSDMRSIGYDMVQLNHYALRSAESFLVKRQRGRALHVDRSIGLNYWTRMDWNGCTDVTIQRNQPRLEAELAALKEDPKIARLHQKAVDWHKAKIEELGKAAEFADLMEQTQAVQLDDADRVIAVLEADMQS